VVAIAGVALGLSLWLATHEWFFRDDFVFLERMQQPGGWTWREVFLPFERRPWIFYRPLSMELFFYWGHRLFGLDAFPYYTFSLALNFATALLVYPLALELGLERRGAAVAALLAVTRAPTLTEIFYGSCFMYVAVIFFGLASALAFLRYLGRGGVRWQVGSCVALVLAFGCNEVAATVPAWLAFLAVGAGRVGLGPDSLSRLARALAPQAVLTAVYLFFRFGLVGPVESEFWNLVVVPTIYTHRLGPHVMPNVGWLLEILAGGGQGLAIGGALLAALFAALLATPLGRERLPWLGRVGVACLAWILLLLPVFALLPQREDRWAMMFAAPVALLTGALVSALAGALGGRRLRVFEGVLLVLLAVTLPHAAIFARAADPVGGPARRLTTWVSSQQPALPREAVIVVLYGAPGLGSEAERGRLQAATSAGTALRVAEPGTRRQLRYFDVSRRPARGAVRPDSVYVKLLPGLRFEVPSPDWLDRELPRGVARRGAGPS